ncbi:MAG: sigma-70 family RNA polymerase sigma factor [Oscillospiraceae bacterium]|nr:sigma-70 family RNA polymerase sigma factor [Oscillospiraceae bacterium]
MEDKQIVELYLMRSEAAIAETEKKYGRYCRYIAYQILYSDEDAKEIANDTYLKVWNTVPPQKPDPLKPYVGMISRQLALNAYEKQHSKKQGGQVPSVLEELSECIPDNSREDIGESLELSDALSRFLRALPKRTRNIFVRRYFYMSTIAEIAGDFRMKESNVTMHLLRTRKKLEQFLKEEGFYL